MITKTQLTLTLLAYGRAYYEGTKAHAEGKDARPHMEKMAQIEDEIMAVMEGKKDDLCVPQPTPPKQDVTPAGRPL